MQILLAPDKFKGTLAAAQVAEEIADRLARLRPNWDLRTCPLADGGDGTLLALEFVKARLETVWGLYLWPARLALLPYARLSRQARPLVAIEAASCVGLAGLPKKYRKPQTNTSYPFGDLLGKVHQKESLAQIALALGGTATVDGGLGFLAALGARFESSNGAPLEFPRLGPLAAVARADLAPALRRWGEVRLEAWCDVQSPLLGPAGAARMFGPQKGASPLVVRRLEDGMKSFADVLEKAVGRALRDLPGAGAGGGLGLAVAALGGSLRNGFEALSDILDLEARVRRADVVVTGEGRLDSSTRQGKAPWGVKALAEKLGKPCYALAGSAEDPGEGWAGVATLFDGPVETGDPKLKRLESRWENAVKRLVGLIQNRA